MMEPVKVEIVFENCEVYECPVQDIKISMRHVCLAKKYPHDKPSVVRCDTNNVTIRINNRNRRLIKRIMQYDDITRICITYKTGEELALNLPWNDAHDEYNTYQCTAITPKYFYITVNKESAFPSENGGKIFVFNGGVDQAESVKDIYEAKIRDSRNAVPLFYRFMNGEF